MKQPKYICSAAGKCNVNCLGQKAAINTVPEESRGWVYCDMGGMKCRLVKVKERA